MADDHQSAILETPFGILAPGGRWYFISRQQIEEYTPGLLQKYPLELLLKIADRWIQSSTILSLITFTVLFFVEVDIYTAFGCSILTFLIWSGMKSAFITKGTSSFINLIGGNIFIYVYSLVFFSYLGMNAFYDYLLMVFILFILVKFPILRAIKNKVSYMLKGDQLKSEEDRVFNMILIKYAMSEGILTKGVKAMETQLFDLIHYNRQHKNG